MDKYGELRRILWISLRVAVGSSLAIAIAQALGLEYATSAGVIALLTMLTTKWETLRLSLYRAVTFFITAALAWLVFRHVRAEWLSYGIFLFLLSFSLYLIGWKATLASNAVIGLQMLTQEQLTPDFLLNELLIVLIGISVAILVNLFHNYRRRRRSMGECVCDTELRMQEILEQMAAELSGSQRRSAAMTGGLQRELQSFLAEAYEYRDNAFGARHSYYVQYFEMRQSQCSLLGSISGELQRIKSVPSQAVMVADYLRYLKEYMQETNVPLRQLERLEEMYGSMKAQALPESREEFESRALLFHILMELEEFLLCKQRFVEGLDERQRAEYWKKG